MKNRRKLHKLPAVSYTIPSSHITDVMSIKMQIRLCYFTCVPCEKCPKIFEICNFKIIISKILSA
jgi:hypothetical protein